LIQVGALPRGRRSPRWFAAVVLLSLLAAACGSASARPLTGVTTEIEKELGFGTREYGLTDAQWTIAVESVQEAIASCMADAGFEYIPADVDAVELAMQAVRTEPGVDRVAYKEEWGYGVTTRFDNRPKEIELGPQNIAIYNSLSPADQVAYDRTLYGDDPDATFSFHFDEEDFGPTGGCTRQAIDASFSDEQLDPNFVNPKDLYLEKDGRVTEAELNWADCMGEAGYDYEDQDEIIEELGDRLDELLAGDDPESLPPARAQALADLQAEEIAVSLVDVDCQIRFTDDVIREVEIELFGKVVSG